MARTLPEPITTRVLTAERLMLEAAAHAAGIPRSTWMRRVLVAAARRSLAEAPADD